MSNIFARFSEGPLPSLDVFKNMTYVPQRAQQHLRAVYTTLAACMALSALGAFAEISHLLIFKAGWLTMLATFGALYGILSLPYNVQYQHIRWGLLCCFSFFQGISLGSLLHLPPTTILFALVATSLIFVSFSLNALFTARRSYLYLGAMLCSAISIMFWMSLANAFLGWRLLSNLELYFGLLVFCGYVVYDTQTIIEKASAGDYDVVGHAVELFSDMLALFVRVLVIFARKDEKRRREDESRKGRKRR